ncbi:MAG: DUF2285 domain-containing protein [Alphaproteobacteria bacterium]|nr:DUF2285 domain-containing protein [Alphaproteobacteria bacterium]
MSLSVLHGAASTFQSIDWCSAEYYQSFREYDRPKFAGEFLCRIPDFINDVRQMPCFSQTANPCADGGTGITTCCRTCPLARWGLRCCRMVERQPVFLWLPQYNPQVLTVEAEAAGSAEDTFDFRQCSFLKAAVSVSEQELHLLFSDGARTLQVIARGNPVLENPVLLRCTLRGMEEFETKPQTLRRLCCLYRQGRLVKSLYPKEERAHYWIKALRAWDGFQAGASYREIAEAIYPDEIKNNGDWEEVYRTRVQRLFRFTKQMFDGRYRTLLRGPEEKKKSLERGGT